MKRKNPWAVRGVDGEEREKLIIAAKLEGMVTGEWLLKVALPEAEKVIERKLDGRTIDDLPRKPTGRRNPRP
jgi:uncharacterized protein (DUF1778 family)